MPEAPRSILLGAYRGLTSIGHPLVGPLLAWRLRRGKEDPERVAERRGIASRDRPDGPLVWIHAASVGETISVVPLIDRIACGCGLSVLLTTGTVTSAQIAEARLRELSGRGASVVHQYVPLDGPRFVRRFLDHWRPGLAIFVESEIWPNILLQASESGCRLAQVNARMSDRSFARWQKRPAMIRAMLGRFDICLAQSGTDADRLRQLGAANVVDTGNLKYDVPAPEADEADLRDLSAAVGDRPRWAAASLHAGEDEPVLETHLHLSPRHRDLLTVLAPRHPERGAEIAAAAAARGLTPVLRSRGRMPDERTDVYIVDTIGEMGLVYRLAPVVFVGGSLVASGGHNPIEAAKLSTAILHGPHIRNTTDIFAALHAAGAADEVSGAEALAERVGHFLASPEDVSRRARAASAAVLGLSGALDRSMEALAPLLDAARRS
ncbi:3-deoxy-D-manno-octulosonic acid transferase [Microbaculum marinum]|uniref:3-deoxy-D-manno-octulosonic acid transferase n=1 Tax=Microbaculum marinum TaxID=1764581 RepID=A0AAW9RSH2_9HYPH